MTSLTTNDGRFDHQASEDSNVIERYLMGRLTTAEAEIFEDHFLDCEECLEKLELSRILYRGMREVAAEDVSQVVVKTSFLTWLVQRSRGFQVALAAGLLILVVSPWALLLPEVSDLRGERQRLIGEMAEALAPRAGTDGLLLSPERSAVDDTPSTRVMLGPAPEWVVLVLQLPPYQEATTYRVRLSPTDGPTLWQSPPLVPEALGQVTLSVHSSWLDTGNYQLELTAIDATDGSQPLARYSFRAERGE